MLNRLGQLVWEAGGLPILVGFIEEGNIDRRQQYKYALSNAK